MDGRLDGFFGDVWFIFSGGADAAVRAAAALHQAAPPAFTYSITPRPCATGRTRVDNEPFYKAYARRQ